MSKRKLKKELGEQIDLDNLVRELEKSDNVFELMEVYLESHAKMNASLHCEKEVIFSTLYNRIVAARKDIKIALKKSKHKVAKEDLDEGNKG